MIFVLRLLLISWWSLISQKNLAVLIIWLLKLPHNYMYLLAKFDESEEASSFDTLTTPITLIYSSPFQKYWFDYTAKLSNFWKLFIDVTNHY